LEVNYLLQSYNMAKIELKKVLEESIKEKKLDIERDKQFQAHLKKFDDGLEKLKAMMRRDGYNV